MIEPAVSDVIGAYPQDCQPRACEALGGAGGFSGAQFWRLESIRGPLCLRCWPKEHPSQQGLAWIHAVLQHATAEGFSLLPLPISTLTDETFVSANGKLWELTPWISGKPADLKGLDSKLVVAALKTLASFHRAVEPKAAGDKHLAPAPAVLARLARLEKLLAGDLQRIASQIDPSIWPVGAPLAHRLMELFPQVAPSVHFALQSASQYLVPLQPCLRDIWNDHVLFDQGQVTGLIDFGAMRMDNVTTDVARLLGSMAGDDTELWGQGQTAYQQTRSLSTKESSLVVVCDRSSTLLSGVSWIEWIFADQRTFEDLSVVADRLRRLIGRLEFLAA